MTAIERENHIKIANMLIGFINELQAPILKYQIEKDVAKEALENYIKMLEQQPCEDCISRQAIKEMLNEEWTKYMPMELDINLSFVLEKISELPSVTPKGVTITDFADRCRECGKQKVGKWIDTGIGREELYGEMFVCSECNNVSYYENYCPNCGAKMEVKE